MSAKSCSSFWLKILAHQRATVDPGVGNDDSNPLGGLVTTTDPARIAALQRLQCFTLAGSNAAIMWYITRHVPAACKTSAIALYALLSGGVFMFASISWAARAAAMRPAVS